MFRIAAGPASSFLSALCHNAALITAGAHYCTSLHITTIHITLLLLQQEKSIADHSSALPLAVSRMSILQTALDYADYGQLCRVYVES
ncbi:hypothetical protein BU26DRAFT_20475 [Trematosphaeria pertusa]|uniref:Uncharacterized protein n=1 Tax=Trematosphaeria pertusa TaxID=390896 RepID=A0A6A6J0L0_9PLEO|nr:uncharacterized protein BU26DRAFT_20475 [Trematosphaeria pertusa]KAF2256375.1 hypothetical protein BU26DRAFT_20475 [Trematosphaeria pertusa]